MKSMVDITDATAIDLINRLVDMGAMVMTSDRTDMYELRSAKVTEPSAISINGPSVILVVRQ